MRVESSQDPITTPRPPFSRKLVSRLWACSRSYSLLRTQPPSYSLGPLLEVPRRAVTLPVAPALPGVCGPFPWTRRIAVPRCPVTVPEIPPCPSPTRTCSLCMRTTNTPDTAPCGSSPPVPPRVPWVLPVQTSCDMGPRVRPESPTLPGPSVTQPPVTGLLGTQTPSPCLYTHSHDTPVSVPGSTPPALPDPSLFSLPSSPRTGSCLLTSLSSLLPSLPPSLPTLLVVPPSRRRGRGATSRRARRRRTRPGRRTAGGRTGSTRATATCATGTSGAVRTTSTGPSSPPADPGGGRRPVGP